MEGVDYSYDRPSVAGLAAAGKRFAVRYVGTPKSGKSLTDVEVEQLTGAGLAVVATYETTAGYMLNSDGAVAADRARAHARMCGMPDGRPIYFALDVDPRALSSAEWLGVERFLDGAASVIGRAAVGVYSGFAAIERLVPTKAPWGWQTYAWSGGHWSTRAQLTQYRNGVPLAGGTVDLCASKTTDYGQWGLGPEEDDMALTKAQEDALALIPNLEQRSKAMFELLTDEGNIGRRTKESTIGVRTLLARAGVDVDEAALAAELAPLLAANARALSDADLAAVAAAVNDEAHRRSAD